MQEAMHQLSASSAVTTALEPLKAEWALQKPRGSGFRHSKEKDMNDEQLVIPLEILRRVASAIQTFVS